MPTPRRVPARAVPQPASLYYAILSTFALHTTKFVHRRGDGGRSCQRCGERWPCGQVCLAAGLLGGL
jgi:hypothetical protein